MVMYYLDTSAVVKCYMQERGSSWVVALTTKKPGSPAHPDTIATALITVAEGGAALARRQRMGEISTDERDDLFDRLLTDLKNRYDLLPVDEHTVYRAADLTQRHPLRGYDAMHLATILLVRDRLAAARLPAPIFVCADANLCAVARLEGLVAENPNEH